MLRLNELLAVLRFEASLRGHPTRDGCPGVRSPDDPRLQGGRPCSAPAVEERQTPEERSDDRDG